MYSKMLLWLTTIPQLRQLQPERLGPEEGSVGLFCKGREVLWQRQDILGGTLCRQRVVFILACRTAEPWPLETALLLERDLNLSAPYFGEDQKIFLEQGRTVKSDGGFPEMEAKLTVEFTTKEE